MKIAGLDIGTTGCKCTVFDEQGRYQPQTEYTTFGEAAETSADMK